MNGSYKLFYIFSGGGFYPVGCLLDNSFSESSEVVDSTTRDNSSGWGSIRPTSQGYEISISGLLTLDDRGSTVITYADLQGLKRSRTKIQWMIAFSDGSGDSDQGYGYITSLSQTASVDANISFDATVQGTGDPSTTIWTPPEVEEITIMIPEYQLGKV